MFNLFNNTYNNGDSQQMDNSKNQNRMPSSGDFDTLQKVRKDLIGEIQAILDYDYHIHNSNDRVAIATWEDIRDEEYNHVGQLLALIDYLDPREQKIVVEGIKEFEDRLKQN